MSKLLTGCLSILLTGFISCREATTKEQQLPAKVTFTEHIAPLLYNNCTICHRPSGGAHFSLITLEDAKKYASGMAFVTRERMMPPWPADPAYTHFKDEKVLSDYQIRLFEKWIKDGREAGPAEKMPRLPLYPEGSLAGQPDIRILVVPTFLKANSPDKFLLTKVPYSFDEVKYASMIEFIPGSKKIVHHVNGDMVKYEFNKKSGVFGGKYFVEMREDTTGLVDAFKQLDLPNDDGTYPVLQKSVVNYLPGAVGQKYPPGIGGFILPRKGAFLLNDVHYGFTGKEDIMDSSYINIFLSKVPPTRPLQEFQLGTLGAAPVEPDMLIQPDSIKFVYSKLKISQDISVLTINPHMHLLGKSFKAYAIKPDGDTIRLISIPRWDFNWQYFYTFKKMVKIPANSIVVAEGIYDNTRQNLNNPFNPPQLITDQAGSMKATDEMFQFIVSYIPYKEGDENRSLE
jgi:hypothetical protein